MPGLPRYVQAHGCLASIRTSLGAPPPLKFGVAKPKFQTPGAKTRRGNEKGRVKMVRWAVRDAGSFQLCWMHNHAAYSVCSPPPCGEGLGVGVVVRHAPRATTTTPTPLASLATLPTRGRVGPSWWLALIPSHLKRPKGGPSLTSQSPIHSFRPLSPRAATKISRPVREAGGHRPTARCALGRHRCLARCSTRSPNGSAASSIA